MSRNLYDPTNDTLTPIGGYQSVDPALSTTSENPVQNKVVASQIQTLINQVSDNTTEITKAQSNIAYINTNSTTASKAYVKGEQFILDGVLREATTAISSGATLTLNSNYKNADSVTTQISKVIDNVKIKRIDLGNVTLAANTTTDIDVSQYFDDSDRIDGVVFKMGIYNLPYINTSTGIAELWVVAVSYNYRHFRIYNRTASAEINVLIATVFYH